MKNIIKYIAFGIALLASSFALNAQPGTYHLEGGMKTSKNVTGPTNGYYTVTLESFATGETTVSETSTPVDIVLVLDVSGSMNDQLYSYTERASQSYSYDSYGNNTYYYLHTDGVYYQVTRERTGGQGSRRYNLHFTVGSGYGSTTYYLSGTGTTTSNPNVSGSGTTIWTGVLYSRESKGTKLANLKTAVDAFVKEVHKNAIQNSDGTPRNPALTNQISVVKYAGPRYYNSNSDQEYDGTNADNLTAGNHRYGYYNYNYCEVLVGFTDVSTDAGVTTVMDGSTTADGVNDLATGGATAADFGMYKAQYLLNQNAIKNRESNKVVVLFTDGEPNHQSGFDDTVASNTIKIANTLKNTNKASVFTIGVFDNETDDIRTYMNYTSSNYPEAQSMTSGGTGSSNKGFYQNASGADLTEIFKSVANAAAAADAVADASTQVRDVISNSFIMPTGNAAGITIKVADIKSDASEWEEPVVAQGVSYVIDSVTTSTGEKHAQLMVRGFDYTKADIKNDQGFTVTAGNWVGERYSDRTTKFWAGKKLIIEFKIKADPEATGGDGTSTNHPDSGVYVVDRDDDGNVKYDAQGDTIWICKNQYDVPHKDLPLVLKITKDGLRKGESATFQIFRIRPKGYNPDGATHEERMDTVKFNALGKPMPGTHEFDPTPSKPTDPPLDPNDIMDFLEGTGWDDWSKVILTNKGEDKAPVTKVLYALDPSWVYMVVEDDWGWAYTLTGGSSSLTTSDVEVNPFKFHNEAKTGVMKHAEAVTINHFTNGQGGASYEEHYKSSKTNF